MTTAKKLTAREEAFTREYCADCNATAAAIRAGYSARNANKIGPAVLARPHVAAQVASLMEKRLQAADITSERVMRELAAVCFMDPAQLLGADGHPLPLAQVPEPARRALAGLDVIESVTVPGDGSPGVRTVRYKYRLADKLQALHLAMRRLGMFEQDNAQALAGRFSLTISLGPQGQG